VTARPFQWKFTRTDLKDLPARIERHEQTEPAPNTNHQSALPDNRSLKTPERLTERTT
jgi:hypothetical protein